VATSDVSVDLALLQRIVARDERAVAELYDRHGRLVFSVIRRILRSQSDAEDVLQETFVRVWSRADTYDASLGSPATWLTRIARNRAVDRLRARQVRADVDGVPPDTARARADAGEIRMAVAAVSDRPDVRTESLAVATALRSAVARLPENQRVLIEAAYFEGYTHHELAARFELPLGTVKTRIRAGLTALRVHFVVCPS
jgi:RNA polymerase sigma-70 factor (ECF subfamily)